MPRPNKAYRRQKVNAAAAYKRGDREEAYKLWAEAAKSTQEHYAKKHNKKKRAAEAAAAEAAAKAEAEGDG